MTIEKATKELERVLEKDGEQISEEDLKVAFRVLKKEPAPSANDTSSENQKDYICKNNDSTEKKKCQEAITAAVNSMCDIYNEMSEEEQRAWELGEVYKRVLDVQRMIEEDRQC